MHKTRLSIFFKATFSSRSKPDLKRINYWYIWQTYSTGISIKEPTNVKIKEQTASFANYSQNRAHLYDHNILESYLSI